MTQIIVYREDNTQWKADIDQSTAKDFFAGDVGITPNGITFAIPNQLSAPKENQKIRRFHHHDIGLVTRTYQQEHTWQHE